MNKVTVWTDSGYSFSTSINGTEDEVVKYYMGQWIDIGVFPNEVMDRVVAVKWEIHRYDS